MTMTGSCLCGTERYAITGAFATAGHCHCSMCRKAHGAAFATWGILGDPQQFRWIAGAESVGRYPAGKDAFAESAARRLPPPTTAKFRK